MARGLRRKLTLRRAMLDNPSPRECDDPEWTFVPSRYLSSATAAERNLAVALRLAGRGLHVFPTRPNKSPRVLWSKQSTIDLDQIRRWWATWRDSIVGLDLAKAGLVVIDADRHGGPDGVAAFEALAATHGLPDGAPVTETPSGGQHWFFRQPEGAPLGNRTGGLPPGIDVRGSGGLVIAPGSALADGRAWEGEPATPDLAEAFVAGAIPQLPAWLAEMIRAPKDREPQAEEQPLAASHAPAGARERAWVEATLAGVAADLAATGEGGRNNELNSAAYRLGRIVARGWLSDGEVRAALEEACRTNGLWTEGPREVRATIASGLRSGLANPLEDLPERDDGDPSVARLAAELGRSLVRDDDGTVYDQDTGEIVEQPAARAAVNAKTPIELEAINAATFAGQAIPEQLWLVDNLIPHANVTLLSGDGATGKSLLALQLGVATATAGDWLGLKPHPGRVVFVSAEDELDELHRRLARMTPRLENLGWLTIVPLAGRDAIMAAPMGREGLLQPTPIFAALRRIVETHGPDLLVLDTLADLFGGDEIKKVHARQFISLLRGMAFEFGVTVLLLSHPSQAGLNSGSGMSGNTAWNNSVRSRLYFERRINKFDGSEDDIDIRVLTTKKSNRAASGGKIVVRYSNGVFIRENGCNFETADRGHHADRVFMSLLAQFERDSRQVSDKPSSAFAPAIFAKHPKSEGLNKGDFEKAMNRLFETGRIKVEEIGPPSRRTRKIAPSDQPGEGDEDSDGGSNGHS